MADVQKTLESHPSDTPSRWRENAEWRRKHRNWLKKSRQVAMAVLDSMERLEMTQRDLAQKMDVTPQYVSRLLKGCENLSLETITKLEEVLETHIVVIQNFASVQPIDTVPNWKRPEFKELQRTKACSQRYQPSKYKNDSPHQSTFERIGLEQCA